MRLERSSPQNQASRKVLGGRHRYLWMSVWLIGILFSLAMRAYQIMVRDRDFLAHEGQVRMARSESLQARRGMLRDRRGVPLAMSMPFVAVFVDPKRYVLSPEEERLLSEIVGLSMPVLNRRIASAKDRSFIYLKRGLDPSRAKPLAPYAAKGVHLREEYRRVYPDGPVFAHVLGMTNIDDQGQEGMEALYNDWLSGQAGKRRVLCDRLGHVVARGSWIHPLEEGRDIQLSLDARLQYIAYRELEQAVQKYRAGSGSMAVLDVKTGEVLVLVNYPSFDPNQRPRKPNNPYARNRALTDLFEPGSTLKPFAIANALQTKSVRPKETFDLNPGKWQIDGHWIRDVHNYGIQDVEGILERSSNIGVSRLTLRTPEGSLQKLLEQLGFDTASTLFPGEHVGTPGWKKKLAPFPLAALSFGYGISSNLLQLVRAYAVLARDGALIPVQLIHVNHATEGQHVLDASVAREVVRMMRSVVGPQGTAKRARIPGYTVAGKTGTVRMVGRHGYDRDRHTGLFVGIVPATRPRLVGAVILSDLESKTGDGYYGGAVAAPVFSKVLSQALATMNIPPDDVDRSSNFSARSQSKPDA